jgi:hypothetical protein
MSGTINVQVVNRCATILLYNESNIGLLLTFPNGDTQLLPAWWARSYTLPTTGTAAIEWTQQYILQSSSAPISLVLGEAFEPAEHAPEINVPLSRQTNVGNQIQNVSNTVVSQVVNDGNSTQNVIEATVLGSSGSNVVIVNDGTTTIKEFVSSTLTALLQIIPGASTPVKLAAAGRTLEVLGQLLVDQAMTVTGSATFSGALAANGSFTTAGAPTFGGAINFSGSTEQIINHSGVIVFNAVGGDIVINAPAGASNKIYFENGGTKIASIDNTGHMILKSTLTQNGTP